MSLPRHCHSCAGPRPRAAVRCPWCHRDYAAEPAHPEHLFADYQGEALPRLGVPRPGLPRANLPRLERR